MGHGQGQTPELQYCACFRDNTFNEEIYIQIVIKVGSSLVLTNVLRKRLPLKPRFLMPTWATWQDPVSLNKNTQQWKLRHRCIQENDHVTT